MEYPKLNREDTGIPVARWSESRPTGWYNNQNGRLRTTTPNPKGYPNRSLQTPEFIEDEKARVYIEKIGPLIFSRLTQEIPSRLGRLKAYVELIARDRFFSTECTLPGSYWVNMFHGLNPQHLNYVHKITQNGIKFIRVVDYQETNDGGVLRFVSDMDQIAGIESLKGRMRKDPLLRYLVGYVDLFRRKQFVSELILHGPFTFELRIPSPKQKYVSFIFTLQPLPDEVCKLYIDFYSNFGIPQAINWFFFHLVTPIVILEDTFHLKELKKKGPEFFRYIRRPVPETHFLKLHQRFLELYG